MTAHLESRIEVLERKMDLLQKDFKCSMEEVLGLLRAGSDQPKPITTLQVFNRSMKVVKEVEEEEEPKSTLSSHIHGVKMHSYHSLYETRANALFRERILAFLRVRPVFYPDTLVRRSLHTILTIAMVAEFAEVTVMAVYCNPTTKSNVQGLTAGWVLASFFWTVELIMRFFTPYFEKYTIRDMKEDLPVIRKRYVNSPWFWFDVIIIVPWDLIFLATIDRSKYTDFNVVQCAGMFDTQFAYSFVHWLRAIRIFRFGALFGNRDPLTPDSKYVTAIKWIMIVFVVLHLLAILCLLVTDPDERGSDPELFSESTIVAYSKAVLWAIQTPVHGTYIIPTKLKTRIVTFIVVVAGLVANLTLAAVLAAFFVVNDPFESMKNDRKQRLVSILRINQVPWEVQKRVHNAYPLVYDHLLKEYNDVLSDLPKDLEEEVRKHLRIHGLRKTKNIRDLRDESLEGLALGSHFQIIPANSEVHGILTEAFIIMEGSVRLHFRDDPRTKVLHEGAIFGNYLKNSFITKAVALKTTRIAIVGIKDFQMLLKTFPDLELAALSKFEDSGPASIKYRDSLTELVGVPQRDSTTRPIPKKPSNFNPEKAVTVTDDNNIHNMQRDSQPLSIGSPTTNHTEKTQGSVTFPGTVPNEHLEAPVSEARSSVETVPLRNDDVFTASGYPRGPWGQMSS